MKKQYLTSEIASLLSPPILSKFNQLQKDSLDNFYASKKYPLGRSKLSTFTDELCNKKYGIPTKQGDSASVLIYPSNIRVLHSTYDDKFRLPNSSELIEMPSAGLKTVGKDLTDNTGKDMKEILTEVKEDKSTVYRNNKNVYESCSLPDKSKSCGHSKDSVTNKISETHFHKHSLLDVLWKLLKDNSYLNPVEFSSFLKAYVQNFSRTFTFVELQKLLKKFGAYISLPALKNVLVDFDVLEDSDVNTEAFLKAMKKSFCATRTNIHSHRTFLLSRPCDGSTDHFKTTSSVIGDHNFKVSFKPAGNGTIQNNLRRPKSKSVANFTDIKNGSSIIQPSLFEQYGVYDDDLGLLRPKEEIKSILHKSGISFNDEMFNLVWKKVSQRGHASIGNIWNTLKNLCLTEDILE